MQHDSNSVEQILTTNLNAVRSEIRHACEGSGRNPGDVTLIAVTKYAEWEWVETLARHHRCFGENRPQQLADRAARLPDVEWHLIGQLQRNKARLAVQYANVIHSVDSVRLLERINRVCIDRGQFVDVLLQVNISEEPTKNGFSEAELRQSWEEVCSVADRLKIRGLMTMAPATTNPESARPFFRALRILRDELADTSASSRHEVELPWLSMGMSGDFVVAVEEGATHVRIGSRIFQGLESLDARHA